MSLGLIMIDNKFGIDEAISCLEKNKNVWLSTCKSYIIYSEHAREAILSRLKQDDDIFPITYDVTDDHMIAMHCYQHFNSLIEVDNNNIKILSLDRKEG